MGQTKPELINIINPYKDIASAKIDLKVSYINIEPHKSDRCVMLLTKYGSLQNIQEDLNKL